MDIDERHESIRKEQFEKIKTGNSVFGLVPSEIGEITFCDSTEWGEKAPTSAEANKFRVWTLVVAVGIIAFFWLVFPNATILNVIVTIAVSLLGVLLIATAGDFSGTDYFIGSDGFAVMKFKNSRSNFVEKHIVRFTDVSDLVDYDIEHYDSKGKYFQSLYSFSFHSVLDKEKLKNIHALYSFTGLHKKHPSKKIDYRYWLRLEDAWYDYYVKKLAYVNKEMGGTFVFVMFESANKDDFKICNAAPFATIEGRELTVWDRKFTPEIISRIYVDKGPGDQTHEKKGKLVIEGIDYTPKKLFKKESGTVERIPLSNVGNSRIFIKAIEKYMKENNIKG